jgi:hypothetical protein
LLTGLQVSEENMELREKCLNQQLELDRLRTELQAIRASKAFDDARSPGRAILSNAELRGKVRAGTPFVFYFVL